VPSRRWDVPMADGPVSAACGQRTTLAPPPNGSLLMADGGSPGAVLLISRRGRDCIRLRRACSDRQVLAAAVEDPKT
jgi:hypothetical protein